MSKVRKIREKQLDKSELPQIFKTVKNNYPTDWLLPLEIYELTKDKEVLEHLKQLKTQRPNIAHLIENGMRQMGFQI